MFVARVTVPPPICEKLVILEKLEVKARVTVPLLLILTPPRAIGEPPVTAPLKTNPAPEVDVREIAVIVAVSLPNVAMAPLNVVVPLPSLCVKVFAVIEFAVTPIALDIVKIFKGFIPPTTPDKVIVPSAADKVKLLGNERSLSIVAVEAIGSPENIIFFALTRVTSLLRITGP